MNISIKTIPHEKQRYPTCGDWLFDEEGNLNVWVSDMGDPIYEWLIAEHEINEALMCRSQGIDEKEVSAFDIAFETIRNNHPMYIGSQEPGDMITAPYFSQHQSATEIEKLSAKHHGVDFELYAKKIDSLIWKNNTDNT